MDIVVLTLGDLVSGIYLIFCCEPTLQKRYWTMVNAFPHFWSLETAAERVRYRRYAPSLVLSLSVPTFQGLRFRTFRVITFVFTGLSGFAPLLHGIQWFGLKQMNKQSGLPYYLVEGQLLFMGAFPYATRVPESIKPGRFDILGCSNQIFHALVVAATSVHAYGILRAFDYIY